MLNSTNSNRTSRKGRSRAAGARPPASPTRRSARHGASDAEFAVMQDDPEAIISKAGRSARRSDDGHQSNGNDHTRNATSESNSSNKGKQPDRQRPESSAFGKRAAEDDDQEPSDRKRQRKDGPEDGLGANGGPATASKGMSPSVNPCQDFTNSFQRIRDQNPGQKNSTMDNAVKVGEYLSVDTTVVGAIASVTEAIAAAGGPLYTLVDLAQHPDHKGWMVRHGHDILMPYALGGRATNGYRTLGGHIALMVFSPVTKQITVKDQNIVVRTFIAHNYDSSPRPNASNQFGAPPKPVQDAYVQFCNDFERRNWMPPDPTQSRVATRPLYPVTQPSPRQTTGWSCGMHAIFTAWAIALGLQLNTPCTMANPEFYHRGARVVNWARLGFVDSETIRNFLACYSFISQDSQVPVNRHFDRTRSFQTANELTQYMARIRLDAELDARRVLDPTIPPDGINALLNGLEHKGQKITNLANENAVEILRLWRVVNNMNTSPPLPQPPVFPALAPPPLPAQSSSDASDFLITTVESGPSGAAEDDNVDQQTSTINQNAPRTGGPPPPAPAE